MRCGIYVRVSTDEQRDNGYSIDSQLRMIKEYCEKNDYDIVDVYNDAGHSGKDLMRPEMQRLLKDIKSHKIEKLIAIKVDRLTRNNYDGFWLLNYCEQNDVKIELILEPYDVSTANGEMIFGMNLVFGQRERKEIGARTKRAMEEMALEKIHPGHAPYGYTRNKETGHLEIEPEQAQVVKEIFELCKKGYSVRGIAKIMRENNTLYKWRSDRVYNILTNTVYMGLFAYGKRARKEKDILYVQDYCEPIIDQKTWEETRKVLEKNKRPNYGQHIHLFTGLVKCPDCGNIMSSSITYKNNGKPNKKEYYFVTCKNPNCKSKNAQYNCDKIEQKLSRILDELTRYIFNMNNEIFTCNVNKSNEIKEIDKAVDKLKMKSDRLVELYIDSNIDVATINKKNEAIKKEIARLQKKKDKLSPNDDFKEYTIELLKKLDCTIEGNEVMFKNKHSFAYIWDGLTRKSKKEVLNKLISSIEIKRNEKYEIEVTNIKFTEEFIRKNKGDYIEYLNSLLIKPDMRIKYKGLITRDELDELSKEYNIISLLFSNEYDDAKFDGILEDAITHFQTDGLLNYFYIEDEKIVDSILLVPKSA